MKKATLSERVAKLEAIIEERTKTLFKMLQEMKTSVEKTSAKIDSLCNHVSTIQKRVEALEAGHMTKTEKLKVYGSIAVALISSVTAIIVALLK